MKSFNDYFAQSSVARRVVIGSLPNPIKVRRLLCGEHSLEVWHVGSLTVPAPRAVRRKRNREQTLLCRASCRGAACGTLFRLRHCPTCSAVQIEPLHAEVGRLPRFPCRLSCSGGCTASRASEKWILWPCVDPKAGRQLQSCRRPAREPVAAPLLVTCV